MTMNNSQTPDSAATVTPSDANSQHGLRLWVGGAGNVALAMAGVGTVTFTAVPAGTLLQAEFNKVLATGTTATNLVRMW